MDNLTMHGGGFSRTLANEAKMGAYYTDLAHCKTISELFKFPESRESEVSVLEPSIGDGSAVRTVLGISEDDDNSNLRVFGVELNKEVCNVTREKPFIEECLNADFTTNVKISNQAFSFVFSNPPYIQSEKDEEGKGIEFRFLERITESYIKRGGILVWVVPHRLISEARHFKYLFNRYERLALFRFRESEYAKYGQVVYIGRRIPNSIHLVGEVEEEARAYHEDAIPVLPDTFEGTELYQSIEVHVSQSADVKTFQAKEFNVQEAIQFLAGKADIEDYRKKLSSVVSQRPFRVHAMGKPPIPLKKDSLYLLATSGAGQGGTGTIGVDYHLQRGVAEIVESSEYTENEKDPKAKGVISVTSHAQIAMTLIETDGNIRKVE